MQYIKTKLLFKPNVDQKLTLPLSENTSFTGLQENIDRFVDVETGLSINDVDDEERFRYQPENELILDAYFYSGGTYDNTYEQAGFTSGETSTLDEVVLRSFYLMQVYDSVYSENQTILHVGYFNGFDFIPIDDTNTTYSYDSEIEYSNLYIPNWYIDALSGESTTLYAKLSFYNAKTGNLDLFSVSSTSSYEEPTVDEDLYYNINLNPTGFTYTLDGTTTVYELQNEEFIEKINKGVDSFDNEKPTYPSGNTFNTDGTYEVNV